jgi:hypothetical protein
MLAKAIVTTESLVINDLIINDLRKNLCVSEIRSWDIGFNFQRPEDHRMFGSYMCSCTAMDASTVSKSKPARY